MDYKRIINNILVLERNPEYNPTPEELEGKVIMTLTASTCHDLIRYNINPDVQPPGCLRELCEKYSYTDDNTVSDLQEELLRLKLVDYPLIRVESTLTSVRASLNDAIRISQSQLAMDSMTMPFYHGQRESMSSKIQVLRFIVRMTLPLNREVNLPRNAGIEALSIPNKAESEIIHRVVLKMNGVPFHRPAVNPDSQYFFIGMPNGSSHYADKRMTVETRGEPPNGMETVDVDMILFTIKCHAFGQRGDLRGVVIDYPPESEEFQTGEIMAYDHKNHFIAATKYIRNELIPRAIKSAR